MKPEFSGIRLTIVELLGAFLPGLVWLVLVASAATLLPGHRWKTPSEIVRMAVVVPSTPALEGKAAVPASPNTSDKWIFGLAVGASASLLGLAINRSGLIFIMAEQVISVLTKFRFDWAKKRVRIVKSKHSERTFPYDAYWRSHVEGLLRKVDDKLKKELDLENLPPTERFRACKYFFKETSPHLWEEVERVEADVSFLCSLAGASLVGVLLALCGWAVAGPMDWPCLVFSLFALGPLGNGYWDNRRREPYLIYVLFLRSSGTGAGAGIMVGS